MRSLRKTEKPLYLCHKIPESDPQQFEPPEIIRINTVATNSHADMVALGEQYKEYRKAIINIKRINEFKEGDRVYIFATPPEIHDVLASTCDFEVVSVLDSNTEVVVLFKRLQNGKY